jgi:hypothetical protein
VVWVQPAATTPSGGCASCRWLLPPRHTTAAGALPPPPAGQPYRVLAAAAHSTLVEADAHGRLVTGNGATLSPTSHASASLEPECAPLITGCGRHGHGVCGGAGGGRGGVCGGRAAAALCARGGGGSAAAGSSE